ncbi:MAG: hypothetical protein II453_04125 [Alphaproteobacteria bacterium]|nr:hypothetical protein [Alphaproteobacteria bacterium]
MPIMNTTISGSGGGGGSGRTLEYEVVGGVLTHSTTASTIIDLTGVTEIRKNYMLAYAYENNTAVSGTADLSSVKYIGGYGCYYMFYGATNITYGDLSSVENVGNTGYSCNSMFVNSGLVTLDLRKLIATNATYVFGTVASGCSYLTTVRLDSLRELWGQNSFNSAFENCTALQVLRFPALKAAGSKKNYLDNMLAGVTGCVVHFPSNMQSVIGSWSSVANGFGGTNTTVLWDLPATVILTGANSTNYERNPQYDTATALAWRVENPDYATNVTVDWTPYYTSGTTDPAVSDTIYSDSACTVAVTTIDSIA